MRMGTTMTCMCSSCRVTSLKTLSVLLQGDPFKTLFVGRISYDITEKKLRREFEEFGPIKSVRLVEEQKSGAFTLVEKQIIMYHNKCSACI
jgi:hypothetical protein